MMFYKKKKKKKKKKKTGSKKEYAKIIHCLNCVAALGTRITESVSQQIV